MTPAAEGQRPLATVVIGGVITSMLFTLFVLPDVCQVVFRIPAITVSARDV